MLRYIKSENGLHYVSETETGAVFMYTDAELMNIFKEDGTVAGLFLDSDNNIWSVMGVKLVDAGDLKAEEAEVPVAESAVVEALPVAEPAVEVAPVSEPDVEALVGYEEPTSEPAVAEQSIDIEIAEDAFPAADELSDEDNAMFAALEDELEQEEQSAEPAPTYQFRYRGMKDGLHRVEDLSDGVIDTCDDLELRQAYNAFGGIEGLILYDDGSIWDDFGVCRVNAPKAATRNNKLHTAKREKKDEFYTQLSDIEKELGHKQYDGVFKDKVIYCPTDVAINTGETRQSQFVHYFQMHAHEFQFKRLIATCLVDRATGDGEDSEMVQNCYVLERITVPVEQRYIYSYVSGDGKTNPVVREVSDNGIKYVHENDSTHPVPQHIVNQAITDASGRIVLVRKFIDHYNPENGNKVPGDVDKGLTWRLKGYDFDIKYIWCYQHPDKEVTETDVLPTECYFFNNNDVIGDFGVFPKDKDGNPCYESVAGGSVCLYPAEYYDYREVEYDLDYSRHCPVSENDYYLEKGKRVRMESGDFRSEYCRKLLSESDIVVTNPPFSLFRSFIEWIIPYGKEFITLADQNCVTYKEVFPLIRENKMWVGTQTGITSMMFEVPDDYPVPDYAAEWCRKHTTPEYFASHRLTYLRGISWFTNIDLAKRHEPMVGLSKSDIEAKGVVFSKYDNYDALNVDKLDQIPMDYAGVMGVPITFIYKYCPDQFEIVAFRKDDKGNDLVFTTEREHEFARTFGRLFDGITWSDYRSKMDDVLRRKEQICQDSNSTEDMKFFAEYICRHLDLAEQALKQRESSGYLSSDSHQSTERFGERLHSSGQTHLCENVGSSCQLLTE